MNKTCKLKFVFSLRTIFALFLLNVLVKGEECELISGESPKEKELLKMLNPLKGKIFDLKDALNSTAFSYKVSICSKIDNVGIGIGAMQYTADKPHSLGRYDKVTIMGGKEWLLLTYQGGDPYENHCNGTGRNARIMIICDPNALVGKMQILEEKAVTSSSDCYYLFEVGSNVTCSFNNQPPTLSKGLSNGSVFCILFFVGISVYLLCGFLYQRIVIGAQGLEQIPNFAFWRDFGNLQADGCDYICRWGSRRQTQEYRGIDEHLTEEVERDDALLNM